MATEICSGMQSQDLDRFPQFTGAGILRSFENAENNDRIFIKRLTLKLLNACDRLSSLNLPCRTVARQLSNNYLDDHPFQHQGYQLQMQI